MGEFEVRQCLPPQDQATEVNVLGGAWGDTAAWRGAAQLALATPAIHSSSSVPQSLVGHQCGAQGCLASEGPNGTALLRCGRCKEVWYCCAEHQKSHWKIHKHECIDPLVVAARLAEEQQLAQELLAAKLAEEK